MAESFARCRGGRFFLSFKIHNPKFNIARVSGSEVGTSEGTRAKIDDGIEERTGYALNTEVDGGEEHRR